MAIGRVRARVMRDCFTQVSPRNVLINRVSELVALGSDEGGGGEGGEERPQGSKYTRS
jgi:hypothetical protein